MFCVRISDPIQAEPSHGLTAIEAYSMNYFACSGSGDKQPQRMCQVFIIYLYI